MIVLFVLLLRCNMIGKWLLYDKMHVMQLDLSKSITEDADLIGEVRFEASAFQPYPRRRMIKATPGIINSGTF
jgi:hypothetical protein